MILYKEPFSLTKKNPQEKENYNNSKK